MGALESCSKRSTTCIRVSAPRTPSSTSTSLMAHVRHSRDVGSRTDGPPVNGWGTLIEWTASEIAYKASVPLQHQCLSGFCVGCQWFQLHCHPYWMTVQPESS